MSKEQFEIKADIYECVTSQIVAAIEAGAGRYRMQGQRTVFTSHFDSRTCDLVDTL